MRRRDRQLSEDEALKIIDESEYATLSCIDESGEIFSVPISPVRDADAIYIHGAPAGTKAKLFQNGRAVTAVFVSYNRVPTPSDEEYRSIANDAEALGSKVYTTEYRSAIAVCEANEMLDDERKIYALRILCEKYTPNYMSRVEFASKASLKRTKVYELKIKSVTAKAKILYN